MDRHEDGEHEQPLLQRLYAQSRQCLQLAAELQVRSEAMALHARARKHEVDDAAQRIGTARSLLADLAAGIARLRDARMAIEHHGDAAVGTDPAVRGDALAQELERRVGERTEQLRRLAAELEVAEDRERRQLARDLHDDLGQTLAALRLRLAPLRADSRPDVQRAAVAMDDLVVAADRSTRALARRLAPALLQERGLAPALAWLADDMQRRFGLTIDVDDDGAPKPLSPAARSIVYRAVRELLINVAKHAGVDRAEVRLCVHDGRLTIQVRDPGQGFRWMPDEALSSGLGLFSVRERLTYLGGTFTIGHRPGEGTCAELVLPLDASRPAAGR